MRGGGGLVARELKEAAEGAMPGVLKEVLRVYVGCAKCGREEAGHPWGEGMEGKRDRKSTRLNSSHRL